MELIIGGAYQGKLTYARKKYGLKDADICTCTENEAPDTSVRCVRRLEEYVLYCLRRGVEPKADFRKDAVLICRDISAGVVPIEPELRAWREATGRFLNELAGRADEVTRLFCGLPQKLK
jgi:adenosyl cobinamide kinase/adenosyl cobinamide phosphate guanylyltransferase